MRRPTLAATVVVAVVATFALAGCTVPAAGRPDPYLGDLSGARLEVIATWSGAEQENFRSVLDEFSRRTHATVSYTSGGTDIALLVNSRLAGGEPPDIAFLPQPGVVAELARRGVLTPITGPAEAAVRRNYSRDWQDLYGRRTTLWPVLQGGEQVRDLVPHRRLRGGGRHAAGHLG